MYKAQTAKGFNKPFGETVAVKTVKDNSFCWVLMTTCTGFVEKRAIRGLLEECTKMSSLDHPNVLRLIGVCLDGGPVPFIVMPFMFNGILLTHLKKERENLVFPPGIEMTSECI